VSGFGMDLHEWKNSNDEISGRLVNEGIATVQFSFAGCGKSEGDYRHMTLERQARQIEDVIAWCLNSFGPGISLGIHATSMGVPSLLLANISNISSLCLVAGVYEVNRSIHKVYEEERGISIDYRGTTLLPRGSGASTPVGPEFWKSIEAFTIQSVIDKVTMPALLIHGDNDTKVTTEEVKGVFAAIPSNEKRLKIFAGGDHGIVDVLRPMREEFLAEVTEWFKKTL
ncbi:MAG: alpha/beta hydrolase, partial [bacterium]|nr:alpha/beta hydrolase [bacterium]